MENESQADKELGYLPSIGLNDFAFQNIIKINTNWKLKTINLKTSEICVLKILLNKSDDNSDSSLSITLNQLCSLKHNSIQKFIGYSHIDFEKKPNPIFMAEYVSSNGNLKDLIEYENNFDSPFILNDTLKLIIIYGIASGMLYLHSNDLIHGNLKPSNILLDDFYHPKITDFYYSNFKITQHLMINSIYSSPETISKLERSKFSDVYSFALLAYSIISQENLDSIEKVENGYRPQFKDDFPESFKSLIEKCMSYMYELGKMNYKGEGTAINKEEAIQYYHKAIDNNCVD